MPRPTIKSGYKPLPKSERKPPVWKREIIVKNFDEALSEAKRIQNMRLRDVMGPKRQYMHVSFQGQEHKEQYLLPIVETLLAYSASIHTKGDKSVTLVIQQRILERRHNHRVGAKPVSPLRSRWETIYMFTIYRTTRDNIAYYEYYIDRNARGAEGRLNAKSTINTLHYPEGIPANVAAELCRKSGTFFTDGLKNRLYKYAAEFFNRPVHPYQVYPLMRTEGAIRIPAKYLRYDNPQDFTRDYFGKRLYRKDLVRAVGNVIQKDDMSRLEWAHIFKDLVPTDWIVQYLNGLTNPNISAELEALNSPMRKARVSGLKTMLEYLSPNERKAVLLNSDKEVGRHIADLIRYIQYAYVIGKVKSIEDWHDKVVAADRERRNAEARERNAIMYEPQKMFIHQDVTVMAKAEELEAISEFRIKIARDYDTVQSWGNYMVNCIASYFSSKCLLGGVYDDDHKLIANFELKVRALSPTKGATYFGEYGYELAQLLGKRNSRLDTELRERIEAALETKGVRLLENRWI